MTNDNVKKALDNAVPFKNTNLTRPNGHLSHLGNSRFPHLNNSGKPMMTLENVKIILNDLKMKVRLNIMKNQFYSEYDNVVAPLDDNTLTIIKDQCHRNMMCSDDIKSFVNSHAKKDSYHPVAEWIHKKPWDGKSRLQQFYNTIDAQDNPLKEKLLLRWLVGAYQIISDDRHSAGHGGVLVLQGAQGIGKTKWFESLVPREIEAINTGFVLNIHCKDSLKQSVSSWIVELGELDSTFKKTDIAALKAHITKTTDEYRVPYAIYSETHPRRTAYCASVNDPLFLKDNTGNRRFWTIAVKTIDYQHDIDMQQLWAEIAQMHRDGEQWWLTPEEEQLLDNSNARHQEICPIQDRLTQHFDFENLATTTRQIEYGTCTEILQRCGIQNPTRKEITRCAAILRKLNVPTTEKQHTILYQIPPLRRHHI